jgi:hypothetical protein
MDAGMEPNQIRILSNPDEIQELYRNLIQSASSEISLIVASPNALVRQNNIGLSESLEKAALERNVLVNLAIPRLDTQMQNNSKNISQNIVVKNLQETEELATKSQNITVRKYLSSVYQTSKF